MKMEFLKIDKEDISFGTFSNKRTDFIDKAKRATALGISNKDVMKCYDEWAVTYDKVDPVLKFKEFM